MARLHLVARVDSRTRGVGPPLHPVRDAVAVWLGCSPATAIVRRSPLRLNSTRPSRVAKTCRRGRVRRRRPGRKRVPRWRTRIIPAFTSWPSKIFTPRRFDSESRPLREEPVPSCVPLGVVLRLRCSGRARLRGRRPRALRADRLDLDLGQAAAKPRVAPVAGSAAVLADPDLVALHVGQHLRGDRAFRSQLGLPVAALEDHLRLSCSRPPRAGPRAASRPRGRRTAFHP